MFYRALSGAVAAENCESIGLSLLPARYIAVVDYVHAAGSSVLLWRTKVGEAARDCSAPLRVARRLGGSDLFSMFS